ncbi:hypothetical protein H8M03_10280 [Sphingomonas sabuli]|uniref:Uncharacterized protein n=1 Tax=Sphingomonas sabuli TaxID=2764186 RepID=A0A7G9L193_9SPHN|nr:hypothetical protein [Sphingomonas sabuli]QNM82392.1 hypothetical protein H8M03_10280 [Sphingomonas sabuli]
MSGKDRSKEEKLAEALRENLRRRKAQARDLRSAGPMPGADPGGDEQGED